MKDNIKQEYDETLISVEEWDEKYKPMDNHIDLNASWEGSMFETYGAELEFVRNTPTDRIWTYCEGDNDEILLIAGYHLVNRIGYFITREPWEDESITILVCDSEQEECNV